MKRALFLLFCAAAIAATAGFAAGPTAVPTTSNRT